MFFGDSKEKTAELILDKDALRNSISELEKREEDLNAQVARLEVLVKDSVLQREINEALKAELSVLKADIAKKEEYKKTLDSDVLSAEGVLASRKNQSDLLAKQITEGKNQVENLKGDVERGKKKVIEIEMAAQVEADKKKKIEGETSVALKELEGVGRQQLDLSCNCEDLKRQIEEAKKQLAATNEDAEEAMADAKAVHNHILELETKKAAIIYGTDDASKEFAKKVADFELEMKKRDEELSAREGKASVKESWLRDKEQTLREAKAELEKHFNRTIPNVLF